MFEKKIMHKYLEIPNRRYNSTAKELQLKKKMQEPGAESCTTILFLKICIFEDDEIYIKDDHQIVPGAVYYISKYRGEADKKFKATKHTKFGKRALIWQAICSCGKKSAPYINESTLTSQLCVKECLQKRLLPLIKSHDNGPVFWPGLVSCHYCKLVMESYEQKDVNFVPKTANPPNCPELRVIEKYWAII